MEIAEQSHLMISPYPSLSPSEALPWGLQYSRPFPFDDQSLRYYYLARNAIYALAQRWNLRDQEVLFPAYCHGVEIGALMAAGVKLRFYPVHANMRVTAEEVTSSISSRTRAVYLIHYLGFPGPVEELAAICRKRGLLLIEDCALALLSRLGDRPLGSFGDAAVFCLYKTLPMPNGGALWMRNPGDAPWPKTSHPSCTSTLAYTATAGMRHLKRNGVGPMQRLLQFARSSAKSMSKQLDLVPIGNDTFDPSKADLGMSRVSHWVLAKQDYPHIVEVRRRNYTRLLNRLRDIFPPIFGELPPGICPLFYPIRTDHKLAMQQDLLARGIETVNFWSRTPSVCPEGAFPGVDRLRRTILEVPCHQGLDVNEIDWIADQLCQCASPVLA